MTGVPADPHEVRRREIEQALLDLVGPDLVEEHRRTPVGHHSPELSHLLAYLRQAPTEGKLAVLDRHDGVFRIVRLSGSPGVPHVEHGPAVSGGEDAAVHEVFRIRLDELSTGRLARGDRPGFQVTAGPYLVSYPDRLSARPGERIAFMASSDRPYHAAGSLVRLGSGGETVLALGGVEVAPQFTQVGSFMVAPGTAREWPHEPFVASLLAFPTRLERSQTLMSQAGAGRWWSLGLDGAGRPVAEVGGGDETAVAVGDAPVVVGAWYLVAAGFDPARGIVVAARPLQPSASWRTAPDSGVVASDGKVDGRLPITGLPGGPVVVAARAHESGYGNCFDGKLEHPRLLGGTLDGHLLHGLADDARFEDRLLVGWEFSGRLAFGRAGGTEVPCKGPPGCEGTLWNTPTEAVTGHAWDGRALDFRVAPDQYAAVHFHSDDLDDCRWSPTVELGLPDDLRSGVYALRLDAGSGAGPIDLAPFFVRPRSASSPLAFLAPTASYLAYANDHPVSDGSFSEATAARAPVLFEDDLLLHEHREWGHSMYDAHLDGSGVGISSARRPLVNMRPGHRYHVGPWQFPADLLLLEWLERERLSYEVVTDEDLHKEGAGLLGPYRAVVTGTHPEYWSTAMLDGLESYLSGGGRLVSLGANGYYWRVAFDPKRPWVMELRRGQAGSRAWESAPGEVHLAFTGETGGLWRHLGRPPQKLVGVGYSAQGFDRSGWYRRLPDSYDPRAAFVFDGVEEEVFGKRGSIGGGAVGQEIDRADVGLGTPRDALVLATSEGLTEGYLRCAEDVAFTVPGTSALHDPEVRADIVYLVRPDGGAVFSTGSIAWSGALSLDPVVSRITRNVLQRFCDPGPLEW